MEQQELHHLAPVDQVLRVFQFPSTHTPAPHQAASVNQFGDVDGYACWDKPGTGKTFTMTLHALYAALRGRQKQWVVLTPPSVIPNWARWLRSIRVKSSGKPLKVLEYVGTPAQRARMDLNVHFALMSYETFKRDYERLSNHFLNSPHGAGLICDEGHKIKNVQTDNFRKVRVWRNAGAPVKLASGTPATTPLDVFAYTRIKNPEAYRNMKHFHDLHVEDEDQYEKVTKWKNLDLVEKALMGNASLTLTEDVRGTMPRVSVDLWEYDLDTAHQRLYDKLAEEKVVEMEEAGVELDALNASTLFHKCQQLVVNLPHFSSDPDATPQALSLVEQWLDELGEGKLAIVANYRMTNTLLLQRLQPHGAVGVYGDLSYAQKQASISRFIEDPACRVIVMQPEAGGVGVDGLQHVCNSMLFLECPQVARQYEQAVARLDRTGQTKPVRVRLAVARKTIQVSRFHALLNNDDLVSRIQRTYTTLRAMLRGEVPRDASRGALHSAG